MSTQKSWTAVHQRREVISHSPRGEDLLLYGILKERKAGFYVDVGAHASTKASVTKFFYDMSGSGWHGINVEPLPDGYANLVINRARDININAACSDKSGGGGQFFVHGEQSTLLESEAWTSKTITVELRTLTDIITENTDTEQDIHFCKIDVEGFEKNVLLGLDMEKIRPWVFCIESNRHARKPPYLQWEYILTEHGYNFLGSDSQNRYYGAAERMTLLNTFEKAQDLLSEYDVWHSVSAFVPAVGTSYFKAYCVGAEVLKPLYAIVKKVTTKVRFAVSGRK